jgi:hypothetical protein
VVVQQLAVAAVAACCSHWQRGQWCCLQVWGSYSCTRPPQATLALSQQAGMVAGRGKKLRQRQQLGAWLAPFSAAALPVMGTARMHLRMY